MKQIKKMQAGSFYLIRGASTANSPFFEGEADCKLFMQYADRFLKKYLSVACFQNNRDGWVMIIQTASAQEIKSAYLLRRERSARCQKEFEFAEVWQMLSDQIRIFLSAYVKATNHRSGRSGSKVRRRYERFIFESEEEAMAMKERLESEYYVQEHPNKRYRPSKKLHKMKKRLLRTSVFVSSALLWIPGKAKASGLVCLDLGLFAKDVVRHLIKSTLQHHIPT